MHTKDIISVSNFYNIFIELVFKYTRQCHILLIDSDAHFEQIWGNSIVIRESMLNTILVLFSGHYQYIEKLNEMLPTQNYCYHEGDTNLFF